MGLFGFEKTTKTHGFADAKPKNTRVLSKFKNPKVPELRERFWILRYFFLVFSFPFS